MGDERIEKGKVDKKTPICHQTDGVLESDFVQQNWGGVGEFILAPAMT
jgi:hypothetical protein